MIENQRMLDLLRVVRSELYMEHDLITEEEYAWLAGQPSKETHQRLQDYDELRQQIHNLQIDVKELKEEIAEAQEELSCAGVGTDHGSLAGEIHMLREERNALARKVKEQETEIAQAHLALNGPHKTPDGCPTYYDGCHCSVATLVHNLKRADDAEAETAKLMQTVVSLREALQIYGEHCMRAGRGMTEAGVYTDEEITRRVRNIIQTPLSTNPGGEYVTKEKARKAALEAWKSGFKFQRDNPGTLTDQEIDEVSAEALALHLRQVEGK